MTEARGIFEWGQTASLMALIANVLRDPKKSKSVKPSDFNPYNIKQKTKAPVSILRDIWCGETKTELGNRASESRTGICGDSA